VRRGYNFPEEEIPNATIELAHPGGRAVRHVVYAREHSGSDPTTATDPDAGASADGRPVSH